MNVIFCVFLTISVTIILFTNPSAILTAINNTATTGTQLLLTLLGIYAIWTGIFEIAKCSGVSKVISKLIRKPIRRLFGKTGEAEEDIAMFVTANIFGISAVATTSGINAITTLDKQNNTYAQNMLFVLASTSLQLIPFSVISLRAINGSIAAYDIILPTIITTFISSFCGALLVKIFFKNESI